MICPNCGSAIPEGSAFCPVCSNAVGSSWPGGPQQGGFTPQQPHQNAGGQYLTGQGPGGPGQFGHGGYDLNFDYPRQGSGMPGQFGPGQTYGMPPYGGQPPKKGKGPLIAAIVGGVAAVVAIVLVVVFLVIPALTGGGSADRARWMQILPSYPVRPAKIRLACSNFLGFVPAPPRGLTPSLPAASTESEDCGFPFLLRETTTGS